MQVEVDTTQAKSRGMPQVQEPKVEGKMKRVLLTGGAGFIGHHLCEHLIKNTDWEIIVLDRLSYASNGFDRLRDVQVFDDKRVSIFAADFTNPIVDGLATEIGAVDYILHVGAETHVDNSITDPRTFVRANVIGTVELLEYARTLPRLQKFLYCSTDEVYGPSEDGVAYKEGDRHNPSNPYAATKSAAESMCVAYANTYKLPIVITNAMNVYGARQAPEKMIPGSIRRCILGEKITIHGTPDLSQAGSRYYIHARNVSDALLFVLEHTDEVLHISDPSLGRFNVAGEREVDNLELVQLIHAAVSRFWDASPLDYEIVNFHQSRPGHDLHYRLDGSKMRWAGWRHPKTFDESFFENIAWYFRDDNIRWLGL